MKRRDVIKSLALLPFAGSVLPIESQVATPDKKERIPSLFQPQESSLHQKAFVMDGHVHVMSRQLLEGLDIGQRYSDGTVDLPRAIEGGLDAMFFSVYSEEDYYPGRYEVKNTFRLVALALDQIEKTMMSSNLRGRPQTLSASTVVERWQPFWTSKELSILMAIYTCFGRFTVWA